MHDDQGNWIGELQWNIPPDPKFVESESGALQTEKKSELVAISPVYSWGKELEKELIERAVGKDKWTPGGTPETLISGARYEYYNVLCVEWEDVVAYRKGLGKIIKSAWEASELDNVDLVLG